MKNHKVYFEKSFPFQSWNDGIADDFKEVIDEVLIPFENECALYCSELDSNRGILYYVISTNEKLTKLLKKRMTKFDTPLETEEELLALFGNLDLK
jgi:hypothetical protein